MKRLILATIAVLITASAFAQVSTEDLAVYQAKLQKQKTELVKKNIKLSDAQAQVFWPLYEGYEQKELTISNQRAAIINDYLKQLSTLTDVEAAKLADRTFSNDHDFTNLQKSYFKKFSDAIGGVNAVKFYQLENYIREIVRLRIQDEIPFIGEISKKK